MVCLYLCTKTWKLLSFEICNSNIIVEYYTLKAGDMFLKDSLFDYNSNFALLYHRVVILFSVTKSSFNFSISFLMIFKT